MKKHNLLEKAMRDFPKGTIARFDSAPNTDHYSNGVFQILDINNCGQIGVYSHGLNCFYLSHDENDKFIGEWAVPVSKPEPLRIEKIAVRVNNEREFKFLMGHYDSLGWKSMSKETPDTIMQFNKYHPCLIWAYHDQFFALRLLQEEKEYKIIDFDFFCAQKGIDNPKPLLTTEDGVDLYNGDDWWCATDDDDDHKGTWILWNPFDEPYKLDSTSVCLSDKEHHKAFHSKEEAEAWILKSNKPKKVKINLYNKNSRAIIEAGEITVCCESFGIKITPSDLEDMLHAYKSLQ